MATPRGRQSIRYLRAGDGVRLAWAEVELDSGNHILLEAEPAWERFCAAVLDFVGVRARRRGEDPAFQALSPREREVLTLITEGLANAEIARRLSLSEKTVRNHISHLFDKLGVWTRAQAIVFARDRGFGS
jgi:DNA-binding NarL/FixJ family response regulator